MQCKKCKKRAVTIVGGVPLCLEHYARERDISADQAITEVQAVEQNALDLHDSGPAPAS